MTVAVVKFRTTARIGQRAPFYHALFFQVLAGAAGGAVIGALWPELAVLAKPLGDIFVSLLKLMVAPIVFCTTIDGIAGIPGNKHIGRTLLKCLLLFYGLTIIGLSMGFAAATLIHPGHSIHMSSGLNDNQLSSVAASAKKTVGLSLLNRTIPTSFIAPFVSGGVLPALMASMIIGIGLRAAGPAAKPLRLVLDALFKILTASFRYLMRLAPIGAFGAIAYFVAIYGLRTVGSLSLFIATMYFASATFILCVVWSLAAVHGFSFFKLMRYMREELLLVLSTSSSESVLPAIIAKLVTLGCGKNSVGISIPLGYSFNLSGTAIYIALATTYLAQTMNVHFSLGQILPIGAVMLLATKTAAGLSGSGFMALTTALSATHNTILLSGTAAIAGIDRFQSEARAFTSLITNITSCVVIAIWEGECNLEQLHNELNSKHKISNL